MVLRTVAVALLLVAVTIATKGGDTAHPTSAQCVPNRPDDDQYYHAGWIRQTSSVTGGVYSRIFNYDPYVAPGPYLADVSLAWTMLSSVFGDRWAQVGWMERSQVSGNDARYTFTQWWDSAGVLHTNLFGAPPQPQPENTYSYYTTLFNNYAPSWISFQVAGVDLQYIPPAGWTPGFGEVFGEILTAASQMAGGYNNIEQFQDTNIWYDGSWKAFDGTAAVTNGTYHASVKWTSRIDFIWDRACAI